MNSRLETSHFGRNEANVDFPRRRFLRNVSIAAAGVFLLPAKEVYAKILSRERTLSFHNINTDEEWNVVCCPQRVNESQTLSRFNYFLRDHHTHEVHPMDPTLLDLLYTVSALTGSHGVFEIVSGYRSPRTNQMLRRRSRRVARRSLHMEGKAVDFRLTDVDTKTLRRVAVALRQGGVGYYKRMNFVHLDTGPVRTW
jgi:uncharacterized protein YcbK (DUF882 family)